MSHSSPPQPGPLLLLSSHPWKSCLADRLTRRQECTVESIASPAKSNLATCPEGNLSAWYDQIRMLDAEGYPHAFLEANGMRLEFRRISQRSDGLHADVVISPIPLHNDSDPAP